MSGQGTTRERRCTNCGAQVEVQAEWCPDCWGERLVWAEGEELADLKQWEAYIQERHLPSNGGFGDEPTVCCDECGTRLETADACYSASTGKAVCGRCKDRERRDESVKLGRLGSHEGIRR